MYKFNHKGVKFYVKNYFFVFSQGSQYVGMAKELCEKYDAANAVFDTAEKVLGYDLRAVTFDGPDTELNKTVNSQPCYNGLLTWLLLRPQRLRASHLTA